MNKWTEQSQEKKTNIHCEDKTKIFSLELLVYLGSHQANKVVSLTD